MPILQIEHDVPNFDGWKKAFENDPIDRKGSGVKRYRIFKLPDEPGKVIVELDFDSMKTLESTLKALQHLWNKVQGTVILNPKTRIIEMIESKAL